MNKANPKMSPHPERKLSKAALLAMAAAARAGKKLGEHRRALGQKLTVWQNGSVIPINP